MEFLSSLKLLLNTFGSPGSLLGAFWGALGNSWEHLGALLGALGASWSALGASWGALGSSWEPLGTLLERSWELPGPLGSHMSDLGCFLNASGTGKVSKKLPKIVRKSVFRIDIYSVP